MAFPEIHTLCLYRNCIPDVEEALTSLKRLHKLRELDLDGNPCVLKRRGYKHHMIRGLPRLEQLDGEAVQPLDRELSELFFASESKSISKQSTNIESARPSTA